MFHSTFQERLIQLKEQRVRLEPPRVRRSRSASTRTQSIRRTSLREKMNTTKKDVQDEKLYFIQSFDAMPKIEPVSKMYEHLELLICTAITKTLLQKLA